MFVVLSLKFGLLGLVIVMSIVKVTRRRQITLPKEACDRLGIAPGDYVKVYVDKHERIVVEKVLGIDGLEGALNPGYQVEGLAESLCGESRRCEEAVQGPPCGG